MFGRDAMGAAHDGPTAMTLPPEGASLHGIYYAKAIGGCPACKSPLHPEPEKEGPVVCPICEEVLLWLPPKNASRL